MELSDNRGQTGVGGVKVGVVITVAIAAIVAAFILPVAINELEGTQEVTIESNVSDTTEVNAVLNETVTATTDGANATIELNVSDGSVKSKTIDVGANDTYQFDRGNVTVSVLEAGTDYAKATYEYPNEFAYSDGARGIWGLVSMALVLSLLLMFISAGMRRM